MLEEEDVFLREGSNGKSSFLWIYIELFIHRIFSCPPPDAVSPNLFLEAILILSLHKNFFIVDLEREACAFLW